MLDSHYEVVGEPLIVPPGFTVYPHVGARWTLDHTIVGALAEGESVDANVLIEYSSESGRYELRMLSLKTKPGHGPEVTGALLRTLRVQHVLQVTALQSLSLLDHLAITDSAITDSADVGGIVPPDEHLLAHVAVIYRAAEIASDNPGQAVAERFGMQRRTAANWIARARAAGYFDRIITDDDVGQIAQAWFRAAKEAKSAGMTDGNG